MDPSVRAFSFVDRITSVQPGERIEGRFVIPSRLDSFPPSLVAEAVGQLAAWSAMAAINFEFRPVAGLAGGIELLAPVSPGEVLELSAELETADREAVSYGGTARVEGRPVIRLEHCVGPMLPMEEYDDPQVSRDRFSSLCEGKAPPCGFGGIPPFTVKREGGDAGQSVRAAFQVPESAPIFADHFPRRPVFPGTLLMHTNLQLAAELAAELSPPATGGQWSLASVSNVKIRVFSPPGERLEVEAELKKCSGDSAVIMVETRNANRMVSAARVHLIGEGRT